MFTVKIDTNNAAFGADRAFEVARILAGLANKVKSGALDGQLFDVNGNRVGQFNSGTIIE